MLNNLEYNVIIDGYMGKKENKYIDSVENFSVFSLLNKDCIFKFKIDHKTPSILNFSDFLEDHPWNNFLTIKDYEYKFNASNKVVEYLVKIKDDTKYSETFSLDEYGLFNVFYICKKGILGNSEKEARILLSDFIEIIGNDLIELNHLFELTQCDNLKDSCKKIKSSVEIAKNIISKYKEALQYYASKKNISNDWSPIDISSDDYITAENVLQECEVVKKNIFNI